MSWLGIIVAVTVTGGFIIMAALADRDIKTEPTFPEILEALGRVVDVARRLK